MLTFLSQMQFRLNILDETRREMNVYLAKDFNVFKYIAPDENRISDIVSNFLDPEGDHGQGPLFLEEFFNIMKRHDDVEKWRGGKVSVIREYATDAIPNYQRRIDILVKFLVITVFAWDRKQAKRNGSISAIGRLCEASLQEEQGKVSSCVSFRRWI